MFIACATKNKKALIGLLIIGIAVIGMVLSQRVGPSIPPGKPIVMFKKITPSLPPREGLPDFPRFNPPSTLFACDISGLNLNRQLAIFTLQGVVNGKSPAGGTQIWISAFNDEMPECGDPVGYRRHLDLALWLNYYQSKFGLTCEEKTPEELIDWAKDSGFCDTYIIYDPKIPCTKNIGTTMCGLYGSILIHPNDENGGLNLKGHGYKLYADLRNGYQGRWEVTGNERVNRLNAYRWAVDNLLPECSKKVIFSLFTGDYMAWWGATRPTDKTLRDYAVASKGFVWLLDFTAIESSPERELAEEIFMQYPPNTPWMGWTTRELDFVSAASMYGHYFANVIYTVTNLSVHASLKTDFDFSKNVPKGVSPEDVTVDPDKVYICINVHSDGRVFEFMRNAKDDSILGDENQKTFGWLSPKRGKAPLSWSITPDTVYIAPTVAQYYYETLSPNDSLGWFGPMGYMYPLVTARCNPTAWKAYLNSSFQALNSLKIRNYWNIFATTEKEGGIWGLTHDADGQPNPVDGLVIGGQAIPASPYGVSDNHLAYCNGKPIVYVGVYSGWGANANGSGSQVSYGSENIICGIEDYVARHFSQRPLFVYVLLQNFLNTISDAVNAAKAFMSRDNYEVVSGDRFLALAKRAWDEGLIKLELFPRTSDGGNNIFDQVFLQSDGESGYGGFSTYTNNIFDFFLVTDTPRGGSGTRDDPYYRYATGKNYWYYQFNVEKANMVTVEIDIAGEYVVEVSTDRKNWTTIFTSEGADDPRVLRKTDLSAYLPATHIYIKFMPKSSGGVVKLYNLIIAYNAMYKK